MSPPARGAWIEIQLDAGGATLRLSRPPHGGRGLKYFLLCHFAIHISVAPRTGGVD